MDILYKTRTQKGDRPNRKDTKKKRTMHQLRLYTKRCWVYHKNDARIRVVTIRRQTKLTKDNVFQHEG